MGSSGISLDFRFLSAEMGSWIRGGISEVLRNHNPSKRIAQLAGYVDGLEDERKKIDPFKLELPRCLVLLEITIVAVKEELTRWEKANAAPDLKNFMTLKKITHEEKFEISEENDIKRRDKMSWMSSVQFHLDEQQDLKQDNVKSCKNRIAGTTLWPLERCTNFPLLPVVEENGDELTGVCRLSLGTPETNNRQLQQITRKRRRCWSPELHRCFIDALQQLGGPQAATPKQIRELMQVDGLSNEEVKSHLQKYRIHTRRFGPSTNANRHVVVGASCSILSQEQCSESSKHRRNSQSGSPQCHTHLAGRSRATSLTGGESVQEEDDEKSVSRSWKNGIELSLGMMM